MVSIDSETAVDSNMKAAWIDEPGHTAGLMQMQT